MFTHPRPSPLEVPRPVALLVVNPDTKVRQLVEKAIRATQTVYSRNVFPAMNVKWGTYPNNIGHIDSPGCFRCHDDEHKTKDGRAIGQDCALCHTEPEVK